MVSYNVRNPVGSSFKFTDLLFVIGCSFDVFLKGVLIALKDWGFLLFEAWEFL
jgi:hypothetical protein